MRKGQTQMLGVLWSTEIFLRTTAAAVAIAEYIYNVEILISGILDRIDVVEYSSSRINHSVGQTFFFLLLYLTSYLQELNFHVFSTWLEYYFHLRLSVLPFSRTTVTSDLKVLLMAFGSR